MRSFLFIVLLCQAAVILAQDSVSLRRIGGDTARKTTHEELQRKLEQGLENVRPILEEANQWDDEGRFLRRFNSDALCARIQSSFAEDEVTCKCSYKYIRPGFTFECEGQELVDIQGLTGYPVYEGYYEFQIFRLGTEIGGTLCIYDGEFEGFRLNWKLCVEGYFCGGIIGGLSSNGFCGCKVTHGPAKCSCVPCNGGAGVQPSCGPFPLLSALCLPLPVIGALRSPSRMGITTLGADAIAARNQTNATLIALPENVTGVELP